MNWDRAISSAWMQISVQNRVDIYNLIHRMKLLEHVLNSKTRRYKNHYQESEHHCKINMINVKSGGPISNNNVFIILLSDPNNWRSAHLLSFFFLFLFFFFIILYSYHYLAIFFFFFGLIKNLLKRAYLYLYKQ